MPSHLPLPELLSVARMGQADRAAMAAGVSFATLMDNAGAAVAQAILARWQPRPVAVLCGPGNNGGDGLVVARLLARAGWPVRLALAVGPERLSPALQAQLAQWHGPFEPLSLKVLAGAALVVDALFGAGLNRPLETSARGVLAAVAGQALPVVAVDVPSGLDGDTGLADGAIACDLTVSFFRRKPGHVLEPGRHLCGELVIADIGIPEQVLSLLDVDTWLNVPLPAAAVLPAAASVLLPDWQLLPAWGTGHFYQDVLREDAGNLLAAARGMARKLSRPVLLPAATPVVAAPDGDAIIHPRALPEMTPAALRQSITTALGELAPGGAALLRLAQALWRLPAIR